MNYRLLAIKHTKKLLSLILFCSIFIVWACNNSGINKNNIPEAKKQDSFLKNKDELEDKVYALNNAFKYDSSRIIIEKFISQNQQNPDNLYYAFLYLSYVYKRLFDYNSVLSNLDSAQYYGNKSPKKAFFETNTLCQKSLALFDVQRYQEADKLMNRLEKSNYQYLDDEYKGKIVMQQAYLKFLNKDYKAADMQYDRAIGFLAKGSPCDLPMILGKKIELYGMLKDEASMLKTQKRLNAVADSCGIIKYKIYGMQTLSLGYENAKMIPKAFEIYKKLTDMNVEYDQNENLKKVREIEIKYENSKKTELINRQEIEIVTQKNQNVLLLSILIITILCGIGYYLFRESNKLKQDKLTRMNFTKQLLENTEIERKRIASDLHDSISHELLGLKLGLSQEMISISSKIDSIINDIRGISRNLHPVLFDKIGLEPNITQLVERMQEQNNFMINTDIDYKGSLNSSDELQIYRIVQEALTNIIKYANAYAAKITIAENLENIFIEIRDNGKGFNVKNALNSGKAFGLHNIIERSRVIGGQAGFESSEEGTIITINIAKK